MIKYIFSANPGRAGSGYLAQLFSHADEVASFHEPEPVMNRRPMIEYLNGNPDLMRSLVPKKLARINDSLKPPARVYAESNHAFIRGFGWFLPTLLPQERIGVVVLRRDSIAIAKSLYRIQVNAFNNGGRGWLIHVNSKKRIIPPPRVPFLMPRYYFYRLLHRVHYFAKARPHLPLGSLKNREPRTPYDLNITLLRWYVDEVYALTEHYKRSFPQIRYYDVETEDLNNFERVLDMFAFFGLTPKETLRSVVGKRVNTKPEFPDKFDVGD